jgi:hypothetical protein
VLSPYVQYPINHHPDMCLADFEWHLSDEPYGLRRLRQIRDVCQLNLQNLQFISVGGKNVAKHS